jgi:hypothetical protein
LRGVFAPRRHALAGRRHAADRRNPFESGTWALFLVVTHGLVYAGLLGSFAGCLSLFAA